LRELARRGAISGVWNSEGDDLVAAARRGREEQPGMLLHSSQSGSRAGFYPVLPRSAPWLQDDAAPDASDVQPPVVDVAGAETPAFASGAAAPDGGRTMQLGRANSAPATYSEQVPDGAAADSGGPALDSLAEEVDLESWSPAPRVRANEAFEGMRLLLTLAALVALGYFGWQRLEPRTRLGLGTATRTSAAKLNSAPLSTKPSASAMSDPSVTQLETAVHSGTDPTLSLGRILPYLDESRGVAVGPEQGLLVIEYTGKQPPPKIRISGRDLGMPPLAVALSAGRHELVLQGHGDSSFRYLIVRAGETRIVSLPLAAP
jgi:hypothetical protein